MYHTCKVALYDDDTYMWRVRIECSSNKATHENWCVTAEAYAMRDASYL